MYDDIVGQVQCLYDEMGLINQMPSRDKIKETVVKQVEEDKANGVYEE